MTSDRPFDRGSYAYAVGRVRALEGSLLDRAKWNRLLEIDGEAQGVRLLREFGYGVGADTLDGMIRSELERAQTLIREVSPDPGITDLFLLPTDAHNLKVSLKARLAGSDPAALLLQGGVFPPELWDACVRSDSFLPLKQASPLGEALAGRLEGVTALREPRLLSAAVDRAVYGVILDAARRGGNRLVQRYFEMQIACLNRLSERRAARLHWEPAALAPMLLPLPPAREDDPGGEPIVPIDEGDSPAAAEGKMNRALAAMLREQRDDAFGVAPLLYYLQARRAEAASLRVLFAAKRSGHTPSLDEVAFD